MSTEVKSGGSLAWAIMAHSLFSRLGTACLLYLYVINVIYLVPNKAVKKTKNPKKLLYCSLVLPQLEYCCFLWSPYTIKHRALIESIQRRATKFILNYPPSEVSYLDRLVHLRMLPLEYRRELRDLLLLYKFKNGMMFINSNDYFIPKTSYYRTRNSDINNLSSLATHKQTYFQSSYFPRAVRIWNDLPSSFKDCPSILSFKKKIACPPPC